MKSHPPESLPCVQGSAAVVVKSASGQSVTSDAATATEDGAMDNASVEELTNRLPTSELIRIIKGALECGKRNLPFAQRDLLRAMTIPPPAMGAGSGASQEFGGRAPRR
jgi:hypothetical protein